ncbi:autophagy-related protein 13-domain-containing protein [Podospora appendiculata]|uniref:Autophagy-related protein 13 n=1 Tax=Podospora appendiculata TaxID=314037 RepID=A0AAE0X0P6_9PEZI|nr:autophagy-related protein 13-domain-containing protein [Podospora appendiculata]
MHQQPRHPPRVSSPASSPQTNPTRTNNQRETLTSATRARAGSSEAAVRDGSAISDSPEPSGAGPSRESIKKLDQIIQNFYYKAAVLILQSRLNLTENRRGEKRINKWFQIETEDIDDFREELRVYKTSGSFENRPPPMIIETYLDASRLSSNQSLVIVDGHGKRWDALEALNSSETSSDEAPRRQQQQKRNTEVILERWRVELRCLPTDNLEEFGPNLPTIYKRSIVFFRSLFVTTRLMPSWKYSQQALAKGIHPALEVKCRILTAEPEHTSYDPLRQPLFDGNDAVTEYMFGDLEVPVGRFYASLTHRNDCNFRVDDSESLLSSRFMGVDENFFKPSITNRREHVRSDSYAEVGSLPSQRQGRGAQEPQQTYGSLSTFHGEGALGTSPMTALKAVRPIGSDTSSPPASAAASLEQPEPPHSLPIRGSAARPSLRNPDGTGRRPSVSFQPFKAGSLSGSPRIHDLDQGVSPHSRPAGQSGISQARNRSSLTAGMAASLRGGPPAAAPEAIPFSGSPKPTPTSRYSSSFTHRRGRASFGGQSKADDDQGSSGKQSLSSSAQPGSGLLAEAGGAGSSGSFATDDDSISDFLKALDSRKTLQSFEPNKKGESSAAKRTAAQLSKFQLMRESNNVLTESMTSSMQLHRSSSSSSRQLANVPSMVNPASMSTSSSPGKPLSPHTPHTPAIPSRLSENSIIDYQGPGLAAHRQPRNPAILATEEEGSDETPVSQEGTNAIDIPLSPGLLHTGSTNRRASSVAQQHRHSITAGEDDSDLVQRSISLGAEEREAPTMSTLLAYQRTSGANSSTSLSLQPTADIRTSGPASPSAQRGGEGDDNEKGAGSASPSGVLGRTPYRSRYQGVRATQQAPPSPQQQQQRPSSRGSFSSGGRYMGRPGGSGGGEDGTDDEPLLFAMSELERGPTRRSLEERRGGGSAGREERDRAFEPRGTSKRGWN